MVGRSHNRSYLAMSVGEREKGFCVNLQPDEQASQLIYYMPYSTLDGMYSTGISL